MMASMPLADRIAAAAAAADFGRPTAVKRGRSREWPYVPVLDHGTHTEQILGRAYRTRAEAVACAEKHVDAARQLLASKLADPRHRALREQHGLPRELDR